MLVRTRIFAAVSTFVFLAGMRWAFADAPSIKVQLWEKSGKEGISVSQDVIEEGPVEFVVTNTSVDPILGKMHEFLVFPWNGPITSLPYDAKARMVDEDKLPAFEGLEDMLPSATETVRLVLKPGKYILLSNQIPGDYKAGMVQEFTVLSHAQWDRLSQSGATRPQ
ncbi:MAG TPA: hypothetical protein VGR52_00445 [Stellaceae bacterium]|nr:hypothetical protein [Stellaceae bacterium]